MVVLFFLASQIYLKASEYINHSPVLLSGPLHISTKVQGTAACGPVLLSGPLYISQNAQLLRYAVALFSALYI